MGENDQSDQQNLQHFDQEIDEKINECHSTLGKLAEQLSTVNNALNSVMKHMEDMS